MFHANMTQATQGPQLQMRPVTVPQVGQVMVLGRSGAGTSKGAEYRRIAPTGASSPGNETVFNFQETRGFGLSNIILRATRSAITGSNPQAGAVYTFRRDVVMLATSEFSLRFNGYDTPAFGDSATDAQIQTAVNALPCFKNIDGIAGNDQTWTVATSFATSGAPLADKFTRAAGAADAAAVLSITCDAGPLWGRPLEQYFEIHTGGGWDSSNSILSRQDVKGSDCFTVPSFSPAVKRWASLIDSIDYIRYFSQGGAKLLYEITGDEAKRLIDARYENSHKRRVAEFAGCPAYGNIATEVIAEIPGPLDRGSVPFYALDGEFQVRIMWKTLPRMLYTNFTVGLASAAGSITSCDLIVRMERHSAQTQATIRSLPAPLVQHILYPQTVKQNLTLGSSSYSNIQANVIGKMAGVLMWVTPAVQNYARDYHDVTDIASFDWQSSTGESLTGHRVIDRNHMENYLREMWLGGEGLEAPDYHPGDYEVRRPGVYEASDKRPQSLAVYSFADDLRSDLNHGTNTGSYQFTGKETLTINFDSALVANQELNMMFLNRAWLSIFRGQYTVSRG